MKAIWERFGDKSAKSVNDFGTNMRVSMYTFEDQKSPKLLQIVLDLIKKKKSFVT